MTNNTPESPESITDIAKEKLSRYKVREQAFIVCFEKLFHENCIEDIISDTFECREFLIDEEVIAIVTGIYNNLETLDAIISKRLKSGWKISRISKVSLCILRIAVYEMLCLPEVPVNVSINEAIELTKKYSTKDDASFVNGVLAHVELNLDDSVKEDEE